VSSGPEVLREGRARLVTCARSAAKRENTITLTHSDRPRRRHKKRGPQTAMLTGRGGVRSRHTGSAVMGANATCPAAILYVVSIVLRVKDCTNSLRRGHAPGPRPVVPRGRDLADRLPVMSGAGPARCRWLRCHFLQTPRQHDLLSPRENLETGTRCTNGCHTAMTSAMAVVLVTRSPWLRIDLSPGAVTGLGHDGADHGSACSTLTPPPLGRGHGGRHALVRL